MSDIAKWLRSLDDPDMVGKSVTPWMLTQFTAAAAELEAVRALADDLAADLDKIDRNPWYVHTSEGKAHRKRLLARYREASQR
jgi:hypothetical protein